MAYLGISQEKIHQYMETKSCFCFLFDIYIGSTIEEISITFFRQIHIRSYFSFVANLILTKWNLSYILILR